MPDLLLYAFLGMVALIVLVVLFFVVVRGLRPSRGPNRFDHSGIDGDLGV